MNNLVKKACFCLFSLIAISHSCKKDDVLPALLTDSVSRIARTSALFKGTILAEAADSVIEYGFCWSTGILPTLKDQHNIANYRDGNNLILYTIRLLTNTKYYVRTYEITIKGTSYSNIVSFTTKPPTISTNFNTALSYDIVSDIDGNNYKTIKIGTQEWMAENLKTTIFNDGSVIPLVEEDNSWTHLQTPGYCWFENNEAIFKNMYGAYYNWFTVNTGLLCPTGWHVPSEEDWKILKISLGMTEEQANQVLAAGTTEGNKIKETGTINWVEGSTEANNESGFTALPGGYRIDSPADFLWEGIGAGWWSSTSYVNSGYAWSYHAVYDDTRIYSSDMLSKTHGLNVRCIKN
jgi:uncharacterized protein (TIGR02145 family)